MSKSVRRHAINSADIRNALAKRFAAPEWAIMWEVADATGARQSRYADAVAMSLWPSRGLELWGFEIKISKSDWKREAADPTKAEAIAKYCDRWFVVTAPGVIDDVSELAPAWGWMECAEGKIVQRKDAAKTEAAPCDRLFLAALLRRAGVLDEGRLHAEIERRDRERAEAFMTRVRQAVQERAERSAQLVDVVKAFEEAAGFSISDYEKSLGFASPADIGRAVRLVVNAGIFKSYRSVEHLARDLRAKADALDTALKQFGSEAS